MSGTLCRSTPGGLASAQDLLRRLGPELADLAERCRAPVTARGPWLQAWAASQPGVTLLPVVVRGRDERLEAALLLEVWIDAQGRLHLASLTPRAGDRAVTAAVGRAAADRAAQALAHALAGCGRPWVLCLGPLSHTDPFLDALYRRLPDVVVVDADPVPLVRPPALPHACSDASDCTTFSVNMRKNLRKATNRLRADGRCAELRFVHDAEEVAGWLDRLWELRCRRDLLVGRLHADHGRVAERFWRAGLRTLAALGEVELGLLHVGGQLAAYVLAVQDTGACRVLEGRFDSALARYSPGKLLEAEMVRRVACGARRPVDWMNGVAPHKLVAATDFQPMRELHAAGGPTLRLTPRRCRA
jgi:hypothetical protein